MNDIIDVHVHLAALPDGKNGCYISPAILKGYLFRSLLKSMELSVEDSAGTNEKYLQRLVALLREAKHVRRAVILAMDGVYDLNGVLNKEETHFLTSNEYVFQTAKRFPEQFLPGASINPQRRDAMEELDRIADAGAALIKVLPNSQQFDPANPQYAAFWKAVAQKKIPVLSHVGYEFSLWGKDQSTGDPARWRAVLDEGVTLIAAHGASFGLFFYEKYWDTLVDFVRRYPNFYWDASALSLPNRAGMLLRLRRHPELLGRMIFGTDYPLSTFAFPALLAGRVGGYLEVRKVKNPFDRHYRLLEVLGMKPQARLIGT